MMGKYPSRHGVEFSYTFPLCSEAEFSQIEYRVFKKRTLDIVAVNNLKHSKWFVLDIKASYTKTGQG